MKLADEIQRRLDEAAQAARSRPAPPARRELAIDADACRVVLRLAGADRIGCALDWLQLDSPALADADESRLRQVGERLAERLHYLLEPLRLIELDPEKGQAILRSDPPGREAEDREYYELTVRRGGALRLERFAARKGQPRRPIPAQLTRQALARLVDDLDQALR